MKWWKRLSPEKKAAVGGFLGGLILPVLIGTCLGIFDYFLGLHMGPPLLSLLLPFLVLYEYTFSATILILGSGFFGAIFGFLRWRTHYNNGKHALSKMVLKDVILSVMLFFLIFSMSIFIPVVFGSIGSKCTFGVGLYCEDFRITPSRIDLLLQNGLGKDLTVMNIQATEASEPPFHICGDATPTSLANGATVQFTLVDCNPIDVCVGAKYRYDLNLTYRFIGSNNTHYMLGELFVSVEGNQSQETRLGCKLGDPFKRRGRLVGDLILPFWGLEVFVFLLILAPQLLKSLFGSLHNYLKGRTTFKWWWGLKPEWRGAVMGFLIGPILLKFYWLAALPIYTLAFLLFLIIELIDDQWSMFPQTFSDWQVSLLSSPQPMAISGYVVSVLAGLVLGYCVIKAKGVYRWLTLFLVCIVWLILGSFFAVV